MMSSNAAIFFYVAGRQLRGNADADLDVDEHEAFP
jgi:hypothetical protein